MFSFSYFYKALLVFCKYPLAIPRLLEGTEFASNYIDKSRKSKWAKKPVMSKHVYNFDIELNPMDAGGICPSVGVDGWYEPEQTELVRKILRKGMVVVDIGANIGWYTLLSRGIIGNDGSVFSFEPEPTNFSFLKRSIDKNNFANVIAYQKCISDNIEKANLWGLADNPGGYSIVKTGEGGNSLVVDCTTIDLFMKELGIEKIDLLKIDAEGAEPRIVTGARESLLANRIRNILIEWRSKVWLNQQDLLNEFLNGFEVFRFVKSPFLIKKVRKESLLSLPPTDLYLRNLGPGN